MKLDLKEKRGYSFLPVCFPIMRQQNCAGGMS
jgi:hypothetical protein